MNAAGAGAPTAGAGTAGAGDTGAEPAAPSAVLQVNGVHKWLGRNHVLRGIDLTVKRGEIVVVIGPSGSGKSTLLRCINHLERIDAGSIQLEGQLVGYEVQDGELYEQSDREVARIRRRIGFVFQQFNLFAAHERARQRHLWPIRVHGKSPSDAKAARDRSCSSRLA